jgi:hypothetical protein
VRIAAALLVACLGPAAVAAAGKGTRLQRAVDVEPGRRIASDALKLPSIDEDAALVYFSPDRRALAEEAAAVQDKINRHTFKTLGIAIQMHGLVLISDPKDLPETVRDAYWLNVDSVSCLVETTSAAALSENGDEFHFLSFFMPAHESVDPGIKAAIFDGGLTPDSASSRWWVEGLADFAAYQSVRESDPRAIARVKRQYLAGLSKLTAPVLDIGDSATWWPKGSKGPGDIQYAYASAHYVVSRISAKHGDAWIGETLRALIKENKRAKTTSADFCRVASKITGEDVAGMVRAVKVDDVRKFAAAL